MTKRLMSETAKCEAEGLSSPSAVSAVGERNSPGERRSRGMVVFCTIGALLVGLGVVAVLAANWEFLTRPEKAAAAIFPVLACALAAYWAAVKKLRARFFWETVGTLWTMAAIAALLIVATVYQASGDAHDLVMAMCVLTLPVVLLTCAALATVGWMVLPVVWFCMKCGDYRLMSWSLQGLDAEIAKAFLVYIVLLAAGGVAVLRTVLASEHAPLASLVHAGLAIILPVSAIVSISLVNNVSIIRSAGSFATALNIVAMLIAGAALAAVNAFIVRRRKNGGAK